MNEIAIEKTMTIKEVADILAVSRSQIEKTVRELFPDKMRNGVTTHLTADEATAVKKHMQSNPYLGQLSEVTTEVEMSEMTVKVLQFHISKIHDLEQEKAVLLIERQAMLPKVESAEALIRCDKNMSVTDAAKHFGLHPRTQVYAFLREKGFLTARSLPTQDAIDANILAVRQNQYNGTDFKPRVVVETAQLEKWRTWLVPRIVEWVNEDIGA